MAAGNMADCIGHGQHGQTEGERYAQQSDADFGKGRSEHCAAATAKD